MGTPSNTPPAGILIVLHGAIGDVTRALTLAVRIKKHWPACRITWAVEPKAAAIVSGHPAIDDVVVFDRPKGFGAYVRFVRELRRHHYDLVLDLQRHFKSGVTSYLSGAKRRLGFHRRNARELNWLFQTERIRFFDDSTPKIWHYQKFGDYLGLPEEAQLSFGLDVTAADCRRAEELLREASVEAGVELAPMRRRVALIIAGTWASRRWPVQRFCELASELYERHGVVCFMVGSDSEVAYANALRLRAGKTPVASLVGKTTLRELVAVLANVKVAVGADSGPMHLAAAVGTKAVSLWGPTDPVRTGPYQNEATVLQSPIGCAPCYRRICPGLNSLCMFDIPAEAVLMLLKAIMEADTEKK
jgi:lipopolysaccharide heptosyltransferase II